MAAKIPIERVGEIMKIVLTELKKAGGEAKLKDLFERCRTEAEPVGLRKGRSRKIRLHPLAQRGPLLFD